MSEVFVSERESAAQARLASTRAVRAQRISDNAPQLAPRPDEMPPGHVQVRIMKKGHDVIFTGDTCPLETIKLPKFQKGDTTTMARDTADKYEDAGMVEIL